MHDRCAPSYENEKPKWLKTKKPMSTKEQEDHGVDNSPKKQRCSQSREVICKWRGLHSQQRKVSPHELEF